VDETLTSHTAEMQLHAQGVRGAKLKAALDAAAACEIMKTWLEQRQRPKPL
jgi:RNase H-fold protein (predicted Holliday junction resolvase)